MTITVYSKPGCHQCDATVRHLEKLGIQHAVVDVAVDAAAHQRVTDLGYSGAPVVVAGEDHWSGYRPDRIKALVVA